MIFLDVLLHLHAIFALHGTQAPLSHVTTVGEPITRVFQSFESQYLLRIALDRGFIEFDRKMGLLSRSQTYQRPCCGAQP